MTATKSAAEGTGLSPQTERHCRVENRDILLKAIVKARAWIQDLAEGRVTSFDEIAKREGKVERHIRLLAPLTFVPPSAITDIADGVFPPIHGDQPCQGPPLRLGRGDRRSWQLAISPKQPAASII